MTSNLKPGQRFMGIIITDEMWEGLTEMAKEQERSVSHLVRRAIARTLAAKKASRAAVAATRRTTAERVLVEA